MTLIKVHIFVVIIRFATSSEPQAPAEKLVNLFLFTRHNNNVFLNPNGSNAYIQHKQLYEMTCKNNVYFYLITSSCIFNFYELIRGTRTALNAQNAQRSTLTPTLFYSSYTFLCFILYHTHTHVHSVLISLNN